MSKRHSTPHSLQFAKLLCWGTFGTLCFRLCTKDLWIFIAALSPAQNNMANPLMNEGFTCLPFFIQTSTYGTGKGPWMLDQEPATPCHSNPTPWMPAFWRHVLAWVALWPVEFIKAESEKVWQFFGYMTLGCLLVLSQDYVSNFQTCLFTLQDCIHR